AAGLDVNLPVTPIVLDVGAKFPHQSDGNADVRRLDQVVGELDGDRPRGVRRRDQKPAEKLAGHFARYADCAALEPSSPDFKGEAVVVVEGADIGAQLPQGLEQGGDGPAPQLVGAVDQPRAFGRGCEGPGEKAGRGAGRTEKELAAGVGPHAGAAVDGDRVAVDGDGDTQSP